MITDRLRYTVIKVNTDEVLTRDLVVLKPQIMKSLSGPARLTFSVPHGESRASSAGIQWKNYGQWIIVDIEINHVQKIFAAAIVTSVKVDKASGELQIEATGFTNYPKGIPWLENFNPIAVDPFEVVQRVWAHCQSYSNANLGVEVTPASSGTQMLPGYGYDGKVLSFDFFAMFIRAVDFTDCGDQIQSLARDIPFDYFEEAEWNEDRTEVSKTMRLAYPFGGVQQDYLTFRLGENVREAEKAEEYDIEPVSDIIIRGWLPGKTYSSRLSNYDTTRLRRTIMEEDVNIDSTERAAAWAKRKLSRRNIPLSFQKIIIDPNHPNAPYGSFDVGDNIYVQALDYPWYGDIAGWHRVTSITYDQDTGTMELGLKVEGAFNYDSIEYNPDYLNQPVEDPSRVYNGYFQSNMGGWDSLQGQWFRVTGFTYDDTYTPDAGCVRVDCDDDGERLISNRIRVTPGEHLKVQAAVRWVDIASGAGDKFQLIGFTSLNGNDSVGESIEFDSYTHPEGSHGWELLEDTDWLVPEGINELRLQFTVTSGVSAGHCFWTYARVIPV
jgi:hypothetical protein